jgi:hypothetical protein
VEYPVFWIDRFHPQSVEQHTAFVARSRAAVDAFYVASLKASGTDNGRRWHRKGRKRHNGNPGEKATEL